MMTQADGLLTIEGFGYNAMTPDEDYRNATDILHTLIDIASHPTKNCYHPADHQTAKGGNFLLNIGPTGTGKIPNVMIKPLLEAGNWLKANGRAIYGTVSDSHTLSTKRRLGYPDSTLD